MASYLVTDYIKARLPQLLTDFPTINVDLLATSAMAVYWSFFFPVPLGTPLPAMEDQILTERRKVICALRACVSILPTLIQKWAGGGALVEAHGGPAGAKFADPAKIYKQIGDMMVEELALLESAEGILLKPGEGIPPAMLLSVGLPTYYPFTIDGVISRNIIDVAWR